ncbi:uncharacterized protein snapc2 isoform X2 [Anguilla rostrata]|uniref:uncharacterized protein snapc2 isoform X2 n=1 Tax=Anguilla rostrata TaxID=7938 RepID=UPI0030CE8B45
MMHMDRRSFSAPTMKPPSRKRNVPLRFVSREPELIRRAQGHSGWFGWKRKERQILLVELKRQNSNAELDLVALQAKLPKKSIQQIESFVQFLKTAVGKRVARLVNRQRREVQSGKVPIEMWTEMAQKMAGSQESAISSAFSQMLVIAATEPCSLLNSDPPRPVSTPQRLPPNLRTVPLRPMARPPVKTASTCIPPRGHASTQLSSGQTPESPNVRCQEGSLPSSQAGASPSVVSLPCNSQSSFQNLASATLHQSPKVKGGSTSNNSPSPASPRPAHVPASLSQSSSKQGATTPKSSQPAEQSASPNTRTTTQVQEHSFSTPSKGPTSNGQINQKTLNHKDFAVDFENIYRFLASVNKQGNLIPLSPMESAVVLDLLLSLPEQIPLLDCVELQHHLRQVYEHLTDPVLEPPLPISTGQEAQSHLAQAGANPPGSSLQREISTIQEGGQLDQSVSITASIHTGSTASDAVIESGVLCSSQMKGTGALPQTLASQEGNGRGQGDKETPDGKNDDKVEYTSQSEASTIPSVSSSKPKAGFQPVILANSGMQDPTVQRAGVQAVGSLLPLQTAQQSTSKSHCKNIPTLSQNIEHEKSIFEKAGQCPLNPFVIPMKLLAQSQTPFSEG